MNDNTSFVGSNQYGVSGININQGLVLHPKGPLYDLQDYPGIEATCCISPRLPWFVKMLDERVIDDIEFVT